VSSKNLLHILPYKITVVPEIKPVYYEKRVIFCNWVFSQVHDGHLDTKLTLFTDETNFNLSHKTTGTGVVKILMP
jgi:hypothetical protein